MSSSTIVTNTDAPAIVGINLNQTIAFTESSNFGYLITPLRLGFDNFKSYAQSITFTFVADSTAPVSLDIKSTSNLLNVNKISERTWQITSSNWANLNAVLNGLYFTFTKTDYEIDFLVLTTVSNGATTSPGTIVFDGWITTANNIVQNIVIDEDRFGWKFAVDGQGQPEIADPNQLGRTYRVTYAIVNGDDSVIKMSATGGTPVNSSTIVFTGSQSKVNGNMASLVLNMGPDYNQNFMISYTQEITAGTPGPVTKGSFTFTVVPNQASVKGQGQYIVDTESTINIATINDTRGTQANLEYTCIVQLPDDNSSLGSPWGKIGVGKYQLIGLKSAIQSTLNSTNFITTDSNANEINMQIAITRPQQKGSTDWSGTQTILDETLTLSLFKSGLNWVKRTTPAGSWRAICATPTHFVAVGSGSGSGMYSTDGINWTVVGTGIASTGICHGSVEGITVAIGGGSLAYSTNNGASWTKATYSNRFWRKIAYDPIAKFMTVGSYDSSGLWPNVYTSTNGIDWTAKATIPFDLGSVIYYQGAWYTYTVAKPSDAQETNVLKSIDGGLTWTTDKIINSTNAYSMRPQLCTDGTRLAFPMNPPHWLQPNGLWETGPTNTETGPGSGAGTAYGNNTFVNVSEFSSMRRANGGGSFDQLGWPVVHYKPDAPDWASLQDIAYKKGVFVAVSNTGTDINGTGPTISYTNSM